MYFFGAIACGILANSQWASYQEVQFPMKKVVTKNPPKI
jgi:hypothetical protein